jgi:RNAse (barnase) inhibitor barstar
MQGAVDFKQMTTSDKLRLLDALWDELRTNEQDVPVQDWHRQILDERERQINEGKAAFSDWETARKRIAKRTS